MPVDEAMRAYYAARAKEYDSVFAKPKRQADLRIIKSLVSRFFSGKRVLDVACGTGYWTQVYAPQAVSIVAVDAVQEPLEIAQNRAGLESVEFCTADVYTLPEKLGSFDAALASFWLSHVPRKKQRPFLEGLHARLKVGSPVLFLDNIYVKGKNTPISERDADGNTYQIRKLRNGTMHRILKNFPTEIELTKMIEGIGTNARYQAFKYYWMFSYEVK
jgi:2-polyprenyl-3-methyl-5-hydroxy-6-metoxy-1,4-benzoquinol methylase